MNWVSLLGESGLWECWVFLKFNKNQKKILKKKIYHKNIESEKNLRGISVLSPIAKTFEKMLAYQIQIFLYKNCLLFTGQHGLRSGHSCENALYELISNLNQIRDKRSIALLLFIDFKKAFDLVDSKKTTD